MMLVICIVAEVRNCFRVDRAQNKLAVKSFKQYYNLFVSPVGKNTLTILKNI